MDRWLVTGCSSGLGRALAAAVAASGGQVVATARKPVALEELVRQWPGQITPVALDVRDAEQCAAAVQAAVDRLGGVDVLVNNAGNGVFGTVEEVSDEELRDQLETLVVGPWRLARLVLPLMRAQGAGHIVNVSSLAGRMAFPGLAAYVTGKHALEGLSQALAAEATPHGVRVTVMEPAGYTTGYGNAMTEAAGRLDAYAGATDEMLGGLRAMERLEGLGRPEDFAATVLKVVRSAAPTPLRVPVGPGAYEFLGGVDEAARAEFAAARALVDQG
ncbi:short-chain dehydrogenase/reductase [Kitasatospora sp. MMS16-BH015]|uniref:SDR family oxidoreductase n=1 Tax=Kitasatospora sp. MMS16-BH015 TaxID=2018025 RepID=UPI000CA218D0|nr:SDR family oxidoreductase [Kitasatospora sp. MMS16-BH015]AUG75055.1 short-chain dehydrogenase/reductase [Kitasatospora sp. MMS16-BH015]